jgi:hypothetical protein
MTTHVIYTFVHFAHKQKRKLWLWWWLENGVSYHKRKLNPPLYTPLRRLGKARKVYSPYSFLTPALNWMEWSASCPYFQAKYHRYPLDRKMDGRMLHDKILPLRGSNSVVQSVISLQCVRYPRRMYLKTHTETDRRLQTENICHDNTERLWRYEDYTRKQNF